MDAAKYHDPRLPDAGLQRAIDETPAGGTLLLPAGRYILKRSLRLKSGITLSGAGPETVLTVAPELPCTELAADAPKGATEVVVKNAAGFEPGMQVTVRDRKNNAWNETFALIREVRGDTLVLDAPMRTDYRVAEGGQVGNLFPALTAEDQRDFTIQFLAILGPEKAPPFNRFVLDAIHLVRCENVLITRCLVERWHSDGFGVQGGRNVRVMENIARRCGVHGFHPGTGLQDSFWSGNLAEENGAFGLYYCWDNRRVIVSRNRFLRNGTYGVGRLGDGRDEDNLVYENLCEANGSAGIHTGMWGDCKRNFVVGNTVRNNGQKQPGAGILLQVSRQNVIARNRIVDDQPTPTQTVGIEEMADGTDENFLVANEIAGAVTPILKRGAKSVVEDAFPGSIPKERLAILEDLLKREEANWHDWLARRGSLAPPKP